MRDAEGRLLPDFIGIGPGRTGTTWLHRVLSGHVDLPNGIKETGFFGPNFSKGMDWYASHFRHADGSRKLAEVSPYFTRPRARERIKQYLPECKLICTIRNPVDHAYSVYKLMRHYVWTRTSMEETLAQRPHLEEANQYAVNLRGWFDLFGRENVLVTRYDELCDAPQVYLNRICDFVQIQPIVIGQSLRRDDVNAFARAPRNRHLAQNARHVLFWLRSHRAYRTANLMDRLGVWRYCFGGGEKFPPLSIELERKLIAHWLPEVERLEAMLGWDLSAWKKPRRAESESSAIAAA
jgi:hypothetical protein